MKLSCLGPAGTFTEQAARFYAPAAELFCTQTIEESVARVLSGAADAAVVPIENSIEGVVNSTVDQLIAAGGLAVKAQINLPVRQNFLVKKEYDPAKTPIQTIFSHPQALAQSRKFTTEQYPGVPTSATTSTAEAARLVAAGAAENAAIGTAQTAALYQLKILHENIQETDNNVTSFAVISKTAPSPPTLLQKTSIVFSTQNKPGELYKILDIFVLWDINMTKIISRPMKRTPGEYVFLIDIEGYQNLDDVNDALKMVQRKTTFYKNLGTYPVINCNQL
ncbi:MAG: prephenate dehydratase [Clostridiales bacterium]|nr:prephenate dehydratase [Clostridiales bacterium]